MNRRFFVGVVVMVGVGLGIQSPRLLCAQLKEGWQKEVEIPEFKLRMTAVAGSKLKLWVEQGWLVARYDSSNRGREWQVVLAQAKNAEEPKIKFDDRPGFDLDYDRYYIREHFGHLTLLREPKTK